MYISRGITLIFKIILTILLLVLGCGFIFFIIKINSPFKRRRKLRRLGNEYGGKIIELDTSNEKIPKDKGEIIYKTGSLDYKYGILILIFLFIAFFIFAIFIFNTFTLALPFGILGAGTIILNREYQQRIKIYEKGIKKTSTFFRFEEILSIYPYSVTPFGRGIRIIHSRFGNDTCYIDIDYRRDPREEVEGILKNKLKDKWESIYKGNQPIDNQKDYMNDELYFDREFTSIDKRSEIVDGQVFRSINASSVTMVFAIMFMIGGLFFLVVSLSGYMLSEAIWAFTLGLFLMVGSSLLKRYEKQQDTSRIYKAEKGLTIERWYNNVESNTAYALFFLVFFIYSFFDFFMPFFLPEYGISMPSIPGLESGIVGDFMDVISPLFFVVSTLGLVVTMISPIIYKDYYIRWIAFENSKDYESMINSIPKRIRFSDIEVIDDEEVGVKKKMEIGEKGAEVIFGNEVEKLDFMMSRIIVRYLGEDENNSLTDVREELDKIFSSFRKNISEKIMPYPGFGKLHTYSRKREEV